MMTRILKVLVCLAVGILFLGTVPVQEVQEEEIVLFSWSTEKCSIYQTLDLTDFDQVGEARYYRISQIRLDCPTSRGGSFEFAGKDRIRSRTSYSKNTGKFSIPLLVTRVTEEDFSWNFTPDHEDIRPGSVSNPSLLTSGGNATASASDTSASFTPTGSSLLVVSTSAYHLTDTGNLLDISSVTNGHPGSGSWSEVEKSLNTGNDSHRHSQFYSQTGGSPGSGTVTINYTGIQPSRKSWIVYEVTGHNTTTPVSESNTGGASTGTTLSIALGSIASGNLGISSLGVQGNSSVTFGTNETELAEATSTGTAQFRTQVQYSTDTTQDWSWTGSSNYNVGVAVEYSQAAAVDTSQIILID